MRGPRGARGPGRPRGRARRRRLRAHHAERGLRVFARHLPACFAFLGTGTGTEPGRGGTPLHSSDYEFNDDVLADGVAFLVAVVRESLTT
ncbi:MAG: hypothetical protein LWW86_04145 [Micrococcales bacterium]|nr:hypothetical protein [Micrococcales bacterium]